MISDLIPVGVIRLQKNWFLLSDYSNYIGLHCKYDIFSSGSLNSTVTNVRSVCFSVIVEFKRGECKCCSRLYKELLNPA